jgi:hypothetical protein
LTAAYALATEWDSLTDDERGEREQMLAYWICVLESLVPEMSEDQKHKCAAEQVVEFFEQRQRFAG